MKQQWARLEAYLKANKPALLADLVPPATDVELYELEHKLGVTLPADFVECLKIHNGQNGESEWLFSGSEFLSSRRILDEWSIWNSLLQNGDFVGAEPEAGFGIQPVWWSPKWIPFTYDGAGNHLCLDLDPISGGRVGQVITLWHDDGARKKKADSFALWFAEFVDKTA